MAETWYVLKDGSYADPNEVSPDEKGVLRHKNGMEVAIGDHGNPMTSSVDPDEVRASAKAAEKEVVAKATAEEPDGEDHHRRRGRPPKDDKAMADYKNRAMRSDEGDG